MGHIVLYEAGHLPHDKRNHPLYSNGGEFKNAGVNPGSPTKILPGLLPINIGNFLQKDFVAGTLSKTKKETMMKKFLKWLGILIGGLLVLVVLAVVTLGLLGGARLNRTMDIQPEALTIPTDAGSIQRGEHLVDVACKSCHGQDLSGQVLLNDPAIGKVYSANLTAGQGGIEGNYTDQDLVRSIRHGVARDGRKLVVMPSEVFNNFSAEDLGAIIAYLRTLPPVDHQVPKPQFTFMARVLLSAGMVGNIIPAEIIDHQKVFPNMPAVGANLAYGEYLSHFCASCHGAELAGGQPPEPNAPPAPNLTPGGELAGWSESDFLQSIRTGVTPSGHQLNSEFMPWESFAKFSDDELKGLWMYLQNLPSLPTATN
jgi:mono/diheme cytochrome c family protein